MIPTSFRDSRALWLLLLFDRILKRAIVWGQLCPAKMLPFLSCKVTFNRGASWSLFDYGSDYSFYLLTFVITIFLGGFAWYVHKRAEDDFDTFGEMLVLVGGTSNLMDRFLYGGVVDFIHLSYGRWSFPIFNFSDVYIVIGVCMMLYNAFYEEQ